MGWVTFSSILVFLGRFVLDLSANTCHTRHVTLTFDLGGHGACRWYWSSCSVSIPSLNFIGLPVRKILGIYCVSINLPGDLDRWPLKPKTVPLLVYPKVISYTKFEHFGNIRFFSYAADKQTDRQTDWLENPTHADRQSRRGYNQLIATNAVVFWSYAEIRWQQKLWRDDTGWRKFHTNGEYTRLLKFLLIFILTLNDLKWHSTDI